jgi:hypothetical protein
MIKFFPVIPAKPGIQKVLRAYWIPGLRSARNDEVCYELN